MAKMMMEKKSAGEVLNKKAVVHKGCGKKHIDHDEFATFNHKKHLCHHCDVFFYDTERGVGI